MCQQLERETDRHSLQRNIGIVRGDPDTHHAERWKQEAALEKLFDQIERLYLRVRDADRYSFHFP